MPVEGDTLDPSLLKQAYASVTEPSGEIPVIIVWDGVEYDMRKEEDRIALRPLFEGFGKGEPEPINLEDWDVKHI
jgi:hypothetical protein